VRFPLKLGIHASLPLSLQLEPANRWQRRYKSPFLAEQAVPGYLLISPSALRSLTPELSPAGEKLRYEERRDSGTDDSQYGARWDKFHRGSTGFGYRIT
jgi:hypothetical protein